MELFDDQNCASPADRGESSSPPGRRTVLKALCCAVGTLSVPAWAQSAPPLEGGWRAPKLKGSGWLEWRLDSAPGDIRRPSNPFDAGRVDLRVRFTAPDGKKINATAFWIKDGDGSGWAVRLLPHVAGQWSAQATVRLNGGSPQDLGAAFSFDFAKVPERRRIVVSPQHPSYFAFEDGTPYIPVGLNTGWSTARVLDDYRRWFAKLAAQGGNFARLWMASWSFGIEWSDTRLGNYSARMDRAELLDQVLQLAEEHGIRVMLCLLNHGAFTETLNSEWAGNPYNTSQGGPISHPEAFVTDPKARAFFARRVRYIAARWSHSPALHSWEWWNEVNWTPITDDALIPWLREMSAVLAEHDPYSRLRSTSGNSERSAVWTLPEIDFVQDHAYTQNDLNIFLKGRYRALHETAPNKPLLMGELGNETEAPNTRRPFNWDSVHLHNSLWASVFNGFSGTGMYWWWDLLVDKLDMWPAFKGISAFLAATAKAAPLPRHQPVDAELSGAEASVLALASSDSVLLWVRAELLDVGTLKSAYLDLPLEDQAKPTWKPEWPAITTAKVTLSGLPEGRSIATLSWFDPESGAQSSAPGHAKLDPHGELTVACPSFERDIAAIITFAAPSGRKS